MKIDKIKAYKNLLLEVYKIRFIENSLIGLFQKGFISGTVHTCVGQEYTSVFLTKHLKKTDFMFSNHRGHGHYISHTNDLIGLLSELLSRQNGASKGYGGSQHLHNDFFISNGIQGGLLSVASGYALAQKRRQSGNIAVVFIGDGTLGAGSLYESLNIMGLWGIPVLIVLEDNGIAQSNPTSNSISGSIKLRPEAFGVEYFQSNIWELDDLDEKCKSAVDYVNLELKPAFLHIKCARINAHSKGDDNRPSELIENLIKNDILNIAIENRIIIDSELKDIDNEINELIEQAIHSKPLMEIDRFQIYEDDMPYKFLEVNVVDSNFTQAEQINFALDEVLNNNTNAILIGEDIEDFPQGTNKQYGGAFKITKGLSIKYKERVINTPISEYTITGLSIGHALDKTPTIAEIMFGDFMTLCVDQLIQNASKFKIMFGKNLDLPFLIRTPMGGRRGYGPTHSQSIEKLFLGFQGLRVLALSPFTIPSRLFETIFSEEYRTPTVLIENKSLYTLKEPKLPQYLFRRKTNQNFVNSIISPRAGLSDIAIFCYGYPVITALSIVNKLFIDYEINCELIFPELISPLNVTGFKEIMINKKTLICIEEGLEYGSVSTQFIAYLSMNSILPKVVKIFSNNTIIPASNIAEEKLMDNEDEIINFIIENN